MGHGMMGPGMWGPGWRHYQPNLTEEQVEEQAKAFVEQYIRFYLPGYELSKKTPK
jgi:hypothetical protein